MVWMAQSQAMQFAWQRKVPIVHYDDDDGDDDYDDGDDDDDSTIEIFTIIIMTTFISYPFLFPHHIFVFGIRDVYGICKRCCYVKHIIFDLM